MTARCSRRLFLSGLAVSAAAPALAASAAAPTRSLLPPPRPERAPSGRTAPDAGQLIDAAHLGGAVGYLVADAATGEVLEAQGAHTRLPPASTAKVLTTLFAFDRLGPSHRFATRLYGAAPPSDGALPGDLVLAGGGDPTLDTDGLAALGQSLKETGIGKVDGKLGFFAGALPYRSEIAPGQPDYMAYNPAVSGLNLNFNRVYFEWLRKGKKYDLTLDARTARYRPEVTCATIEVADRSGPVYTFEDGHKAEHWTVAGRALGKKGGRWLPVRHPGRYAAEVFRSLAATEGVAMGREMSWNVPPTGLVLAERKSDVLTRIAREMLKYSTNITAEVLGLSASGASSQAASADAMNRFLATRFGTSGIRMVDHSGLGPASRVTATDMVSVLIGARQGALPPLLKPVPIRDDKGRPMRDYPMKVHAKTGTLNFVSTLVGYADVPGRRLAFAILTGDVARRAALDDQDRPPGGRAWIARSKHLQQGLLRRWGVLYAV